MGFSATRIDLADAKYLIKKNKMQLVTFSNGRNHGFRGAKFAEITDHAPPKVLIGWADYPPDFAEYEEIDLGDNPQVVHNPTKLEEVTQ